LPPRCVIVAALGITGGTSIGVTNFVTPFGSSVPPGICASATGALIPGSRPNK
jgi:hypothetical protein